MLDNNIININMHEVYRLQLEFPDDFYMALQNLCSFALDYLSKQIDGVIEDANLASKNPPSKSGKGNYRDVFVAADGIGLQFDPYITFFSLVRKSMVFESDAVTIKGAQVEEALTILKAKIADIAEKYPTTNNYSFTPEEYEAEKNHFVADLAQVKREISMLDDDFPKQFTALINLK